ncbi:alginate export family protein, partial [Blastomonas sp.]|uniref:alginate export family protein n=1 Tax=Blastomonas sp. TaxID=1909299 RepID=UPI003593B23A
RNRQLMTAGARLFRAPQPGHWDIDAEGALQLGTIRASTAADAARQDVRAYFFHAELGRSFDLAFRPRMSAMFDIASGDDPRSSRFSRFDTLFGARRWELGPTGIFGPLARTNIVAPGLRFEAAPAKGWDVMALWRPTWLHSRRDRFGNTALADASGQAGRFVGHMLEARIGHWLVDKRVRIEAGTALLTNGAVRRSAPNAPRFRDTRYGYGQLTFSF